MEQNCPNCGFKITNSHNCLRCGYTIQGGAVPTQTVNNTTQNNGYVNQQAVMQPTQTISQQTQTVGQVSYAVNQNSGVVAATSTVSNTVSTTSNYYEDNSKGLIIAIVLVVIALVNYFWLESYIYVHLLAFSLDSLNLNLFVFVSCFLTGFKYGSEAFAITSVYNLFNTEKNTLLTILLPVLIIIAVAIYTYVKVKL